MKDLIAGLTTIAGAGASLGLGSSVTVATIPMAVSATVPAGSVLGWLGVTTSATTVVAAPITVPVAGIVAVGALLTYGGYKAYELIKSNENKS